MSEKQSKLIDTEGDKTATPAVSGTTGKSSSGKSKIGNAKEMYALIKESNEDLRKHIDGTSLDLTNNVNEATRQIVSVTDSVKESNDKVVCTLIETEEKIEVLTQITEILNQRLCDIETGKALAAEESKPQMPAGLIEVCEPVEEKSPAEEDRKGHSARELYERCVKEMARRDGELADKKFLHLMEKMCNFREDYSKLISNMGKELGSLTKEGMLESFGAYLIDMENMLIDAGVTIGHHGESGAPVDTTHQRIIGVVPTDDASKNGTVAERLSEAYEYNGRAIIKEKVNVYKLTDTTPAKSEIPEREILG